MKNVFLFDLDGVLIDDETIWNKVKEKMYVDLFGKEIVAKMGSTVGGNMEGIYELAKKNGSTVSKEEVLKAFYDHADSIYQTAPLTDGIEDVLQTLENLHYKVGIVSASPREWIDIVLNRIEHKNVVSLVLSLFDRKDLLHKPEPDGYLEAIKAFNATAQNTIVLEDSNAGIASAKAAGAYTIGLKQNLVEGYVQQGADTYADDLGEVIKIVKDFANNNYSL